MKSNSALSLHAWSRKRRSSGGRLDDRLGLAAEQPRRRVLPQAHIVVPQRHLRLHQPRRVRHQPRRHLEKRGADRHRVGHADLAAPAVAVALARQEIGDQPPALLGDFGQMPRQFGLIHSRLSRRFDPPRRNRSGSARLRCAFRFACRSSRLFLAPGALTLYRRPQM